MIGLENSTYLLLLVISNMVAILFLVAALRSSRLSRILFSLLFLWAGWTNWATALKNPNAYLEYSRLTFSKFYSDFIDGWFTSHIQLAVGFIATCQLLIAVGLQAKGIFFRIAALAAIVFFIAIVPLGVGSGFPCTLILAIAMFILFRHAPAGYLWESRHNNSYQ